MSWGGPRPQAIPSLAFLWLRLHLPPQPSSPGTTTTGTGTRAIGPELDKVACPGCVALGMRLCLSDLNIIHSNDGTLTNPAGYGW